MAARWLVLTTPHLPTTKRIRLAVVMPAGLDDLLSDPAPRSLDLLLGTLQAVCQTHQEIDHAGVGRELLHTIPWHLSATPPRLQGPAPRVGEHNAYVLGELLGLSLTEQARLDAEGVV